MSGKRIVLADNQIKTVCMALQRNIAKRTVCGAVISL